MGSRDGIDRRSHPAEPLSPTEIWAQPWTLAFRDIDNTTNLIDIEPTISILTPDAVESIRDRLYNHASHKWRLRFLLYMSVIEVGVATVEVILPKPTQIEVITSHYERSPFLTAAFTQPSILPSPSSPDPQHGEILSIRLLQAKSVNVGSKVIVIRVAYEKLQRTFELCAILMIGLLIGVFAGVITRKVDVGIAVTAAWLQFAQLFQAWRWLYS